MPHRFASVLTAIVLALILTPAVLAADQWLENDAIRARISTDHPVVLEYQRKDAPATFAGAASAQPWKITVIAPDRSTKLLPDSAVTVRCEPAKTAARYTITCREAGQDMVQFTATITLDGDQVIYRITDVRPAAGYLLAQVDFNQTLRVALADSAPRPAVCGGDLGRGRSSYFLEDPTNASPRPLRDIDMIMLCQEKAVAVGYNNLAIHPWRCQTAKTGNLGEFLCPPYVHTVTAGAGDTYTAEAVPDFVCRIGILADRGGDGAIDWRDGAGFIRDNLPGGVPLFQEYMRYEASDDFDNFIKTAQQIYHITDGRPQLCLHAGWQYWGWDSEYPAYQEPAEELGGRPALYRLMREAPKYRCIVSIIHNWDDAYKTSPAWDESLIMRRENQSLLEATAWAGGRSFIMGPFKMSRLGWADQVLNGLTAQGARLRIFSDVLSAVPERVDYDRNMPSDALANLWLGKYKIIEKAKARGITIGSETVTWPFVGRLCTAHSMPMGISDNPNEVPLGPFVLHGKMAYQVSFGGRAGPTGLLAGADNATGWNNDAIYLNAMVLEQYASRPMTNYTRDNGVIRTEFGDKNTFVEWNRAANTTRVAVDGRLIHNGVASFIPKKTPDVFLAYSRQQAPQRFPRPKNWTDLSNLQVYRLTNTGEQKAQTATFVSFDGDDIVLSLNQGPYRLCYGQAAYDADRKIRETPFDQPSITWPEDKLLSSTPAGPRPDWIRKSTRKELPGATLYVGCGDKFATAEQSKKHAASIVARKIAWAVRQGFVYRSRDYEKALNLTAEQMGFDNWNLGVDEPLDIYSADKLSARTDVPWYVEQVQDNNPQLAQPRTAFKAFVCVPVTKKDLHDVYLAAIRNNLQRAKDDLAANRGNATQSQNCVRIWTRMLEEESKKTE